jgi:GDPmannose 4,6-dehydratase
VDDVAARPARRLCDRDGAFGNSPGMCRIAFEYLGLDMDRHIVIDPALLRPAEVRFLLGNSAKAKTKFGWEASISLEETIREMVDADLARVRST